MYITSGQSICIVVAVSDYNIVKSVDTQSCLKGISHRCSSLISVISLIALYIVYHRLIWPRFLRVWIRVYRDIRQFTCYTYWIAKGTFTVFKQWL